MDSHLIQKYLHAVGVDMRQDQGIKYTIGNRYAGCVCVGIS